MTLVSMVNPTRGAFPESVVEQLPHGTNYSTVTTVVGQQHFKETKSRIKSPKNSQLAGC